MVNIAKHMEISAKLFPRQIAILFEGQVITYEDLQASIARFAAGLKGLGVERGDRVAIYLPNIPAFAIAYYAAQAVGAIAVSVNTRCTRDEVRFVLGDSSAKAVVTTGELRAHIADDELPALTHVVVAEGDRGDDLSMNAIMTESSQQWSASDMDRHDPAVILYTSGTTGMPKGATLSQGNVISNVWSFVHNCGIQKSDRILLQLPLFHCFGQNALLNSAVLAGATLVLQRGFRPDTALQAIEDHEVTMLFAVPTMFSTLVDRATPGQFRSVRYFFSAAASLPMELERRWQEKFGRVITQGYGLTETSPFASYNHFQQYRFGSIGTPIENVEMRIVDPQSGRSAPPGEPGEIAIRGPNVMLGYWNRPVDTAKVVRNGWFHSGDIGTMDEDGYFYIVDRLKDMIDVGGMNVYPVEVENALYAHEAVAESAVYGVPDSLMGEQVCAAVVLKPDCNATTDELVRYCAARLADFKVPRVVEMLSELPKNPSGKILKRVLRERAASRKETENSNAFAQAYSGADSSERRQMLRHFLADQVARVLKVPVEQIDPCEPLTDLGLESLMAVDLATRIRGGLGIEFTALSLVGGSTLNQVVDALVSAKASTH